MKKSSKKRVNKNSVYAISRRVFQAMYEQGKTTESKQLFQDLVLCNEDERLKKVLRYDKLFSI